MDNLVSLSLSAPTLAPLPPINDNLPFTPSSTMTRHLAATRRSDEDTHPHFVLIPLMAQGHMIPMVDMARLLAARGALVSLITTPVNASRIKPIIDSVAAFLLPIKFIQLPFPAAAAGLPDGCENVDLITSPDHYKPFFEAAALLREPLLLHLRRHHPPPTCMITDYCHPWTMQVSQALNIPRLLFHGPSCFYILAVHNNMQQGIYEKYTDPSDRFVLPGLEPYNIEVTLTQALGFFTSPGWEDLRVKIDEAEAAADGVVINSYSELEPLFIALYKKVLQKRVWAIGPLSLHNKDVASMATRGNRACIDENRVLEWLDPRGLDSVVYVNFGSLVCNTTTQLIEVGLGLESSGYQFIWVIKENERSIELDEWLVGFEDRVGPERGLVIKGWAPQVVILSHRAVGGFVTHCGWNSTLEAVAAGVPVLTWPRFADQFLNEKLVVEVLRVGVAVGVAAPSFILRDCRGQTELVGRGVVKEKVVELMEGERRRERVREVGEKARVAMEEGGSSFENLTDLVKYVTQLQEEKNKLEDMEETRG